jgi:DNA-binding CsgD family transcriptional regulator/sugar-specific transcriptional regulator TrmB
MAMLRTGKSSALEGLGLDETSEQVYRVMLARPGATASDICDTLKISEQQVRQALDRLFEMSLARPSVEHPDALRAVTPDVGLRYLLARQEAEVARRQRDIAESQAAIAAMVNEFAATGPTRTDDELIVGLDAIHTRLEQLTETASKDILGFTPGPQSGPALNAARRNDSRLIERGIAIRDVIQDSCRNDPETLAHARWLTAAGGEVRTAPSVRPRMILIDQRLGIVPVDPENSAAGVVMLHGRGPLAALVALFEQVWRVSVPLGADRAKDSQGLSAQERELLHLLSKGMTDEGVAKGLGVSERTVRRIMAELMERLGARSRFEAGLKAAQRGWLT